MSGRPTTLYELCEQVCEAISDSPANYYQDHWAILAKLLAQNLGKEDQAETCGTAFCRAGWMINILEGHRHPETPYDWKDWREHIHIEARTMLQKAGIDDIDIHRLFGVGGDDATWGTKEYAEQGVKGMRTFMAKYEDKLKAAQIPTLPEPQAEAPQAQAEA